MYWWSDTKTNRLGEDLNTCLRLYGTGTDYCPAKDMGIKVLFLDSTKSFGYSWLLVVTKGPVNRGRWCTVKCHSESQDTYIRKGNPVIIRV